VDDYVAELGQTVGDALLTPTRIYARPVRKLLTQFRGQGVVHGIAHITGGGLAGNLERIIPAGVQARLIRDSWDVPPVFRWLQGLGNIDSDEMDRVFNMGVGLALVVPAAHEAAVRRVLDDCQLPCWRIGEIAPGPQGVVWQG
jgi:phosphoribosylformylglycinamidine cyclo-ligase